MFHYTKLTRISLLLLMAVSVAALEGAPSREQLPRRGAAGVAVATDGGRVVIGDVFPNTAAAKAGLQQGDVILSIDGAPVAATPDFVGPLSRKRAGDTAKVEYQRGAERAIATLTLLEWPREKNDAYDVTYGEVVSDGHRLRTIATKPKTGTPRGTLFLVQGLGCGSIDNPPPGNSYPQFIASLSKAGYATLRVDKPGTGDSEGGPCAAVDYHAEVRGYRAALATLKDAKNVFLFGHSMGGIQAPLIADGFPVAGVIVYGSTFKSWAQYAVSNQQRQMRLSGAPFEEIEAATRRTERLNTLFYVQKKPLAEIVKEHPEFREQFPDGKTFSAGKEGKFFQQLYDVELANAWKKIAAPVLSVYGASDFLTDASEHEWLAAAINSWRPGTAKFVQIEGIDHWIGKAADQRASMTQQGSEYDARLAEVIVGFMGERAK